MRWFWLAAVACGCTPTGPAPGSEPAAPAPVAPAAPDAAPVAAQELGKLQLRDHTVTIERSTGGPVYTVAHRDGTVVLDRADGATFEKTLPALFHDVETSFARTNIDARAEMPIQADL